MDILVEHRALLDLCQSQRMAERTLGRRSAVALKRRLADLAAATRLGEVVAGHPHPLRGDRAGQFALELGEGRRLVICPTGEPPRSPDGSINWPHVTSITITYIGNYHD